MDEFYTFANYLPPWLCAFVHEILPQTAKLVQEIRLRSGKNIVLMVGGKTQKLSALCASKSKFADIILTQRQIKDVLFTLCDGSIHSFETELAQGFVTVHGHRVGVAGKYIKDDENKLVLQRVTSLNIRIARAINVFLPEELKAIVQRPFKSLVVLGAPSSGKTTVLRHLASEISHSGRVVVAVDEREELFLHKGKNNSACDVILGVEKGKGVQMALRTLSPEVIVLDEIGELDELYAIKQGYFAGVDFVVSMHAKSFTEAEKKPQFEYMLKNDMLRHVCLLQGREHPGRILQVREY